MPPVQPRQMHARCSKHAPYARFAGCVDKVSETEHDREVHTVQWQLAQSNTKEGRARGRGAAGDFLTHQVGDIVPRSKKFVVGGAPGGEKVGLNAIDERVYSHNLANAMTVVNCRNGRNRSKVSALLEGRYGEGVPFF